MHSIQTNGHNIFFGEHCYTFLKQHLSQTPYSKIFVLTDSNTSQYCLPQFLANLATDIPFEIIEIEPGEEHKNILTCTELWQALTDLGADRKSLLVNLGGGVITDMGGFVAATFKRGIAFINIPTTLLAMVDASVGGKTGIDLGVLKNQVGIIINPVAVLIDKEYLNTLPANQMRSGLAEMLKHGLIADTEYWWKLNNLNDLTTEDLEDLIYTSVTIKNNIVLQDPTEKGIRKTLNFGHTIGHAVESYCLANINKETLLHGEAIAVGMVTEAYLSKELSLLSENEYKEIKKAFTGFYPRVAFTNEDINEIILLLSHDKKNDAGKVQFVLLNGIGKTIVDKQLSNSLIFNAFQDYQN
ncbi:3-dehydroquinate synthase [Flavobacterium rhizosphaerae]|uniref:3-dehydroquinate synthase n=1 Tax=Flavobacterium rhizosphaerae TaxID=3163298 RepID=A0ABW8YUV4_9FLAO